MKIANFQERLESIDSKIKTKVETILKYLFENSSNFEEMTYILDNVDNIVQEQIKKVDTNKFKK